MNEMLVVERIQAAEEIRRVVTAPEIYRHISDDGSPPAAEYCPVIDPSIYYLGVYREKRLIGVFVLIPQNVATIEVHTCMTRAAWGESATATRLGTNWIWANTPFQRIITNVPIYNKLARRLAECSGMTQFGVNVRSFLKGGKLYDQLMFGISREAPCR